MGRRSSISRNPKIKAAVDEALAGGATIDEVADAVRDGGISRSAVGRYAKNYRPLVEEVLRYRAVRKKLQEHFPDGDGALIDLAIHKATMQALRAVTAMEEEEAPPNSLELSRHMGTIGKAAATTHRRLQTDQLIREAERKKSAEIAVAAAREAGANEALLDVINRRILGMA